MSTLIIGIWAFWCLAVSGLVDRYLGRSYARYAELGMEKTGRLVRRAQGAWLPVWIVAWILCAVVTANDDTNRDAIMIVVPLAFVHGPFCLTLAVAQTRDLVLDGASPEIARAVLRSARPWALLGGAICATALGVALYDA